MKTNRCILARVPAVFFLAACCPAAPLPGDRPREEATLKGHNERVTGLAFSPDGKALASISYDSARLWDLATGKCLASLDFPPGIPLGGRYQYPCAVAFRPDGKAFVTFHQGGALHFWDPATGRRTDSLRHSETELHVAFSPDSKCLASACGSEVRVRDLVTGRSRTTLKYTPPRSPLLLAYVPEGKALLVRHGDNDNDLTIWDAIAGTKLSTCEGHDQRIVTAALSPDGKTLVSSSIDQTLRVWEVATGKNLARLPGETYGPLAFSPDGKVLACAWNLDNRVGAIRLLAFPGCTPLATIKENVGVINGLAFSPDGRLLAAGCKDKTIKIWGLPASWPQ